MWGAAVRSGPQRTRHPTPHTTTTTTTTSYLHPNHCHKASCITRHAPTTAAQQQHCNNTAAAPPAPAPAPAHHAPGTKVAGPLTMRSSPLVRLVTRTASLAPSTVLSHTWWGRVEEERGRGRRRGRLGGGEPGRCVWG